MEDHWTGERLGRPGVWVAGRALVITLIVLLAIIFDRGDEPGRVWLRLGDTWPSPLGYLAALALVYASSCLYFAVRQRVAERGALIVLALDVPIVTAIVHWTGGIDSQFVLVYLPLALAGGILRGVSGGATLATIAAVSYLLLLGAGARGWLEPCGYGGEAARAFGAADTLRVVLHVTTLLIAGLLSGLLGRLLAERGRALRAASQKLARARLDTAYVIEHLDSGLLSLDEAGYVLLFNRAAGRILDLAPERVVGRRVDAALPAGVAPFVAWLDEARRGEVPLVRQELEVSRTDGTALPLGMTGSRMGGGTAVAEAAGLIVLFQDLTRAHREAAERVRQERLVVIGSMAAGITHEIRNCVKPISGSLDVLLRELELTGANERLMQLAVRECGRLGRFVQAMLDYGRVNPLIPVSTRLDSLLREVKETVASLPDMTTRHALDVELGSAAEGCLADVDPEQLRQVLLNLALNGLEAMGETPGTLTLGLDALPEEPDRICLTVRDTGTGMDETTRAQIFEPFFTTKRGGTGFGLAIAASIVERHGGWLEVESSPGEGALFRIMLRQHAHPDEALAA